ncbi:MULTISPECIES: TetR family transcriptional regulator [unclassified Solwaraspora]|uniref:TetR/AcrR family transcriptional regulator n=1 Tax=unclassified Solwaraspora TaxID=2627926 RepID=UPI00248D18C1|nr:MULTISPECIES: TetR family transcriptional regulator [unclassified Solwaraspora]WBB99167.1 TetR family transcriptional regulator [Solwaraspora sp. WMMA2059]WBC22280.1 TetR family transcriptional regulator [Solwaraspora sp. WMMA2080]WFE19898.1 TetR family transcriptional regulator [Solwaraspora sp. WMMD937]WJK35671.1 TetR family transcriptional regulator [Solwaraspora sp. WMMA2065]
MVRDSTATKHRILDAATVEFAAHGLAGARVDRVAERAGANKQLIYAYFGSKERLFDTTLATHLERFMEAVPFDADDIPGYATAMFDFGVTHPDLLRLLQWHTLERPGELARMEQNHHTTRRKLAALAEAQAAGLVDDTLPPAELLAVVLAVARAYDDPAPTSVAARRASVTTAVRRLVTPGPRP